MHPVLIAGLAVAVAGLVPFALLVWLGARIERRPERAPRSFAGDGRPVLACLGDSITHGRIGSAWVPTLARALPEWQLVNAGINGETAFALGKRLDEVLACRPSRAVVLIGSNDVLATFGPTWEQSYRRKGALDGSASPAGFEASLRAILDRLRGADVQTAVISIPPMGEDPASAASASVDEHNRVISRVAHELGLSVLPLHASLPGGPDRQPMPTTQWALMRGVMGAAWQHELLGRSWDEIAERGGWACTVEGLHLNDAAGGKLAALVEAWVRGDD